MTDSRGTLVESLELGRKDLRGECDTENLRTRKGLENPLSVGCLLTLQAKNSTHAFQADRSTSAASEDSLRSDGGETDLLQTTRKAATSGMER